ncbi:MAG: hypothetical protein ACJ73E_06625 [Mycobacteriales bacterium]
MCVPAEGAAEVLADVGRLLVGGCSVVVALEPRQPVDLGTVAALARLVLTARRCGGALVVRSSDRALVELAELMGLSEVLGLGVGPPGPGSSGPGSSGPGSSGPDPGSGQAQR